jgi:hypothetical protein
MLTKAQPANKEEQHVAQKILEWTDPEPQQSLRYDVAVKHLFPRLLLPELFHQDGLMTSPIATFNAAWQVIIWLKVQKKGLRTDPRSLRYNRVEQLVRLLGYAQTGEVIAGVEPEVIVYNMLQTPGPSCRVYDWIFPLDQEIFEPANGSEDDLMLAIMVQGGQYLDGKATLERQAAWVVLQRSKLHNDVLALIWNLVDPHNLGYLTRRGVVKMLRLISCASRGMRLHPRLVENREHPLLYGQPYFLN